MKIDKIVNNIGDVLVDEWIIWRLYLSGKATLHELENEYSLDDVIIANTVLDIQDAIEGVSINK